MRARPRVSSPRQEDCGLGSIPRHCNGRISSPSFHCKKKGLVSTFTSPRNPVGNRLVWWVHLVKSEPLLLDSASSLAETSHAVVILCGIRWKSSRLGKFFNRSGRYSMIQWSLHMG
jgi:hypothetical protein